MRAEIKSREEFNGLCKMREAEGVYRTPDATHFLTVRPHGIFLTTYDGTTLDGETLEGVLSFSRKLPPIPGEVLEEIIEYFRENLDLEAAVRICYDEQGERFFFVKAGGFKSAASIAYDYSDSLGEILRDGVICVMDVHSHNRMGAFWSNVDDRDELASPGGLYGVIGRLQDERPSMKFRACLRGLECDLKAWDVFDVEPEKPKDLWATDDRADDKPFCDWPDPVGCQSGKSDGFDFSLVLSGNVAEKVLATAGELGEDPERLVLKAVREYRATLLSI